VAWELQQKQKQVALMEWILALNQGASKAPRVIEVPIVVMTPKESEAQAA
jgi:hypothetical protein